ncbi:hypothetical protein [Rufibacter quisquiliarum]|uniref:Uncharacterized protein n=1 Tax=Rufibacter quisquiliarum TaxID=1549639 RepID=A0A839GFP6_9BACT|nr:hypothetical protein [Rufibacter quisquiliarum]MBA9077350.1 hypothetical protein [Rufibacter quisquiliarum]
MSTPPPDFSFLPSFYEQDTLYVVPEENAVQLVPGAAPVEAATVPVPPPAVAAEAPVAVTPAPAAPAPVAAEKREERIEWLGEAVKGTYLLFQVPDQEFGQLPQHPFLQKVMAAVGLTTMQVQFGNLSTSVAHNVKQIALQVQARHILLFGDDLTVENLLKLEPYRMYRLEETRFVRVDSLANIEKSTELKKKLWDVLQKIFLQ